MNELDYEDLEQEYFKEKQHVPYKQPFSMGPKRDEMSEQEEVKSEVQRILQNFAGDSEFPPSKP